MENILLIVSYSFSVRVSLHPKELIIIIRRSYLILSFLFPGIVLSMEKNTF